MDIIYYFNYFKQQATNLLIKYYYIFKVSITNYFKILIQDNFITKICSATIFITLFIYPLKNYSYCCVLYSNYHYWIYC